MDTIEWNVDAYFLCKVGLDTLSKTFKDKLENKYWAPVRSVSLDVSDDENPYLNIDMGEKQKVDGRYLFQNIQEAWFKTCSQYSQHETIQYIPEVWVTVRFHEFKFYKTVKFRLHSNGRVELLEGTNEPDTEQYASGFSI